MSVHLEPKRIGRIRFDAGGRIVGFEAMNRRANSLQAASEAKRAAG